MHRRFSRAHRRRRRPTVTQRLRIESLEKRHLLSTITGPPPEPVDDTYTIEPGQALNASVHFGVLGNDRNLSRNSSPAAELVDAPLKGDLELLDDGSFTYRPNGEFDGTDTFRYRIAGSEQAPALVTIGTPQALDDVVRYRLEIVDLDGQSVTTGAVGEMLELRVYGDYLPDDGPEGIMASMVNLSQEGVGIVQPPALDSENYLAVSPVQAPGQPGHVGSLRLPDRAFGGDEELLFRTLFTAQETGSVSFSVGPTIFEDSPRQWNVYVSDPVQIPREMENITYGAVDYGNTAQVDFVTSDLTAPTATDDFYKVDRGGVLEVNAASGVIANDTAASGQTLTAELLQGPRQGTIDFREDGSFTYNQSYHGITSDRFYYLLDDGERTAVGTVLIGIEAGDPPPPAGPPPWQNPDNRFDVNADGFVTPVDQQLVENAIRSRGVGALPAPTDGESPPPFLDVNGDGSLTFADRDQLEDQFGEDLVSIRLSVVDQSGEPVNNVLVGEEYRLQVYARDLRPNPQGVFAAFTDIDYEAGAASPAGQIEFSPQFPLIHAGVLVEGRIDEAGAARNVATSQNAGDETLVFEVSLSSAAAGQVLFTSNPTENLPPHDILLLGRDTPVPQSLVDYGDVIVTVGELDGDAPQAAADSYTANEDEVLTVSASGGVLANDTDANGDSLSAQLVTGPSHGTVSLNADGSFTYTPNADFAGEDEFRYRATDGTFTSPQTEVVITVQQSNADAPRGVDDRYVTGPDAVLEVSANDGVLANDFDPDGEAITASLVTGPANGTLELDDDGSFRYSPAPDFVGQDSFSYQASDGILASDPVTVQLDIREAGDAIVRIRLEAVDSEGKPIDEVSVGDTFQLHAYVEDLRATPLGVFAAYTDVEYNSKLAQILGDLEYGETYINGQAGDLSQAGVIDEAGAFTSSFTPLGGGEFLLFAATFQATTAGEVTFAGNPADELPLHDIAVYGLNDPVPGEQIDFDDTTVSNVPPERIAFRRAFLRVTAGNAAQDDGYTVPSESVETVMNVLDNDLDASLRITAVTTGSEGGTATVSADGKQILYTPPAGFIGTEHFTYTAVDLDGGEHRGEVSGTVVSRYQNQDNHFDTDGDGVIAPLDALFGINRLNERGARRLAQDDLLIEGRVRYLDINGDGHHSSGDVLAVINRLNAKSTTAEGEGGSVTAQHLDSSTVAAESPAEVESAPPLLDSAQNRLGTAAKPDRTVRDPDVTSEFIFEQWPFEDEA